MPHKRDVSVLDRVFLYCSIKMKKILKESELKQIREAPIVTATCLTASNLPQDIKEKFDILIIDEAGFANDWLCLPLILSGMELILDEPLSILMP